MRTTKSRNKNNATEKINLSDKDTGGDSGKSYELIPGIEYRKYPKITLSEMQKGSFMMLTEPDDIIPNCDSREAQVHKILNIETNGDVEILVYGNKVILTKQDQGIKLKPIISPMPPKNVKSLFKRKLNKENLMYESNAPTTQHVIALSVITVIIHFHDKLALTLY